MSEDIKTENVAEESVTSKRKKRSKNTSEQVVITEFGTDLTSVESNIADAKDDMINSTESITEESLTTPDAESPPVIESVNVTDNVELTGMPFTVELVLLYASSVAPTHFSSITGTYYFWDSIVENGRIRITDSPNGVGKPSHVIGWVEVSYIQEV